MIAALCRLMRIRLALLNGVAAAGGCLLYPGASMIYPATAAFLGVALSAGAASAWNQVLEADLDRLMSRTNHRPIPCGAMTKLTATIIGAVTMFAGAGLLASRGSALPLLVTLLAIGGYLVIYTPLKRRSSLSLPLGALCGSVPPLVGWSLAGGSLSDYRILLLAGLLFLWQIPHFWLLQSRYLDDYQRAGIPAFSAFVTRARLPAPFHLWIFALVAAAMLLPGLGLITAPVATWYILLVLALLAFTLLASRKTLSVCLDFFPLLVTLAIGSNSIRWG